MAVATKGTNTARRVERFEQKYGTPLLHLLCHAALPVALTPELLHLLRINFFAADSDEPLTYFAEVDLLCSDLCRTAGEGLYDIEEGVRDTLLLRLVRDYRGTSENRLREVASLLWKYGERGLPWAAEGSLEKERYIGLEQAQRLTALGVLDTESARKWLEVAETTAQETGVDASWFVAMQGELGRASLNGDEDEFLSSPVNQSEATSVNDKDKAQKHILWVDDNPDNNIYEREIFKKYGFHFTLALSTATALDLIAQDKFAAIISDMGRKEGPREGYVLLDTLRSQKNETPFFFYAGSSSLEHERETLEHGGQGNTNNIQELVQMVTKAVLGASHPDTATSLNNLALLYDNMGRVADALPLYERALAIRESELGASHPSTATSLNNLAVLYKNMGRVADALPLYERALAICESELGASHPDTAMLLNNLAVLYDSMGRFADALPLYERTVQIFESELGASHPLTATSLNNLALLYDNMGRVADALPLFERALAIRESALGASHPLTATSLNNLALLYDNMGRVADALPLFERALAIRESELGASHPLTAGSLNNLAGLYYSMGRVADALPLFERALAIRESALGASHPDTATSLNNLAVFHANQGEWEKALPLMERAVQIRIAVLGEAHPNTRSGILSLQVIQEKLQPKKRLSERLSAKLPE